MSTHAQIAPASASPGGQGMEIAVQEPIHMVLFWSGPGFGQEPQKSWK